MCRSGALLLVTSVNVNFDLTSSFDTHTPSLSPDTATKMDFRYEDLKAQSSALGRYVNMLVPFISPSLIFFSLLDSPEHSDLLIRCKDGTSIHAHKNILCAQSKFFANACKRGHFMV